MGWGISHCGYITMLSPDIYWWDTGSRGQKSNRKYSLIFYFFIFIFSILFYIFLQVSSFFFFLHAWLLDDPLKLCYRCLYPLFKKKLVFKSDDRQTWVLVWLQCSTDIDLEKLVLHNLAETLCVCSTLMSVFCRLSTNHSVSCIGDHHLCTWNDMYKW